MRRFASWTRFDRAVPLVNRLATRSTETAAWFCYLHALSLVDAGALDLIRRAPNAAGVAIVVRDPRSGDEWSAVCPMALPAAIEEHAIAEYRRLVAGERRCAMDATLFAYLFGASYCSNCQYRGERQVCLECRYGGGPVNFLPFEPEAAPPLPDCMG
jgi:hypothetical protein